MSHEEEMPTCKEILEYQDNESENEIEQDQIFFMNQTNNESKINDNIWIVDSGTSYHMTN